MKLDFSFRTLALLAGLLGSFPASGQYYSLADGYRLADGLYANDLLSLAGRDRLKQDMAEGHLVVHGPTRSALPKYGDTVSVAQLLGYLYVAYQSAYVYRQGIPAREELMQERGITRHQQLTDDQQLELAAAVRARIDAMPGRATEAAAAAALPPGEAHPRSLRLVMYGLPNTYSDDLIPVDRSSFGYSVATTLQVIARLGLISKDALNEKLLEIARFGPVADYAPLEALAKAAGEREITRLRVRNRSEAISYLSSQGLLEGAVARTMLADTNFLQSESRQDLYAQIQPQFFLSLQAPRDLRSFYAQMTEQLCSRDPRFCRIRVTATPDPAYARASGGENRHFNLVGSTGSGVFYTGPDLFLPPLGHPLSEWGGTYMLDQLTAPYNALLRRDRADYRLYFVAPSGQDGGDTLLLRAFPLTSPQARALSASVVTEVAGGLQGPDPQGFLSPTEAVEILDTLEALGFFQSLTPEQRSPGRSCAEADARDGLVALLACYPDLYLPASSGATAEVLIDSDPLRALPGTYYLFYSSSPEGELIYLKLEDRVAQFLKAFVPGSSLNLR